MKRIKGSVPDTKRNLANARNAKLAGRPKMTIDWDIVIGLCEIQCTLTEAAGVLRVGSDTLAEHVQLDHGITWTEFRNRHGAGGKMSLRRKQWKLAVEDGHPTMLIWLGKQYLGQKDRHELSGDEDNPIRVEAGLSDVAVGDIRQRLLGVG